MYSKKSNWYEKNNTNIIPVTVSISFTCTCFNPHIPLNGDGINSMKFLNKYNIIDV